QAWATTLAEFRLPGLWWHVVAGLPVGAVGRRSPHLARSHLANLRDAFGIPHREGVDRSHCGIATLGGREVSPVRNRSLRARIRICGTLFSGRARMNRDGEFFEAADAHGGSLKRPSADSPFNRSEFNLCGLRQF